MSKIETLLVCAWCGEPVAWSRFLDDHYCSDCRTSDVIEQPDVGVRGALPPAKHAPNVVRCGLDDLYIMWEEAVAAGETDQDWESWFSDVANRIHEQSEGMER